MPLRLKLLALAAGIVFFLTVLRSIRRRSMKPSYAVLWIAVSAFLMSVPILEPFYKWLAHRVMGIEDARTTIYIALLLFILVYLFYASSKISRMDDRIQQLISYTAVMNQDREPPSEAEPSPPSSGEEDAKPPADPD